MASAVLLATTAFSVGKPERLVKGEDYAGALCGTGELADLPYIYYPQLASDLRSHPDLISSAPWTLPLYGVCVASCPGEGDVVEDYGCRAGHRACRWRRGQPAAEMAPPNQWRVPVRTARLVNRCLPARTLAATRLQLCSYPSCEQANKPCYGDEPSAGAHSWLPSSETEMRACQQIVTLETTRDVSPGGSALERAFIDHIFGSWLGAATDVYLGAFEIVRPPPRPRCDRLRAHNHAWMRCVHSRPPPRDCRHVMCERPLALQWRALYVCVRT